MDLPRLYEITTMKPSEFVRKYLNIQLFDYQKELLDKMSANKYFLNVYYPRGYSYEKRFVRYYNMCLYLDKIKNDDFIMLASLKEWRKMNKKEFKDYLLNEYWK